MIIILVSPISISNAAPCGNDTTNIRSIRRWRKTSCLWKNRDRSEFIHSGKPGICNRVASIANPLDSQIYLTDAMFEKIVIETNLFSQLGNNSELTLQIYITNKKPM